MLSSEGVDLAPWLLAENWHTLGGGPAPYPVTRMQGLRNQLGPGQEGEVRQTPHQEVLTPPPNSWAPEQCFSACDCTGVTWAPCYMQILTQLASGWPRTPHSSPVPRLAHGAVRGPPGS